MKTMNKYFWMIVALMGISLGLTSCYYDEDEHVGNYVSGHWFGDLDMWINNEKARGSEIEFIPTGWGNTKGHGTEVDYYTRGYVTHYFNYHIRDGVIYMTFDDPDLDCAIVDYRLSYTYFSGYIADYFTLENLTYFNLRNYDRYWNEYGYGGYYDPYYYTKGEMADSTATDSLDKNNIKCIRGVNRGKEVKD